MPAFEPRISPTTTPITQSASPVLSPPTSVKTIAGIITWRYHQRPGPSARHRDHLRIHLPNTRQHRQVKKNPEPEHDLDASQAKEQHQRRIPTTAGTAWHRRDCP
jgi:hypothetical protein